MTAQVKIRSPWIPRIEPGMALHLNWESDPTALGYELFICDESGQCVAPVINGCSAIVTKPSGAAQLKVRVSSIRPPALTPIPFEARVTAPTACAIDLDAFAAFDENRLPILRFNHSADTQILVTEEQFTIDWEEPKRGRAVQLRIYNQTKKQNVHEPLIVGANCHTVDLSTHAGDLLQVYGRILFKDRWSKRVNACGLRVANKHTAALVKSQEERLVDARRSFVEGRPRDVAANVRRLLSELSSQKVELSANPLFLSLKLGYDCNLDCLMCDEGRVKRPHKPPTSLITDVLKNCLGTATCLELIGGEPLLYPEAEQLAAEAEKFPNLTILLTTNATLLREKWRERIVHNSYRLAVSLDGATKETYEAIRGKASFEAVVGNLLSLKEAAARNGKKVELTIAFVIQKRNWHEIVPMVDFAHELGASGLTYNLVEYPSNEEWIRVLDAVTDRQAAQRLLDELRRALKRARQLGLTIRTRAIPRLINMFPSLVENPEEALMLPSGFASENKSEARPDMQRREQTTASEFQRITDLRQQPVPDQSPWSTRVLPALSSEIERLFAKPLTFLRDTRSRAFCDFPFTVLHLDTYRTFVCCQAQHQYLYGHRYDRQAPTVFDVWNSPFMQAARQALYDGRFDEVCHTRCQYYQYGGTYEHLNDALRESAA